MTPSPLTIRCSAIAGRESFEIDGSGNSIFTDRKGMKVLHKYIYWAEILIINDKEVSVKEFVKYLEPE